MTVTTDDLRRLGVDDRGSVSPVNTPYLDQFIPASHLKKGEHLKTPNGATAVADGGVMPKVHDGWMWDLTVPGNNDHDFYVTAEPASHGEDAAVLVHNCSPGESSGARFTGYTDRPPTDELPDLNTNVRFVGKEDGLPIDLANPLDLADHSGEPDFGLEPSSEIVEAGENLSDLAEIATGAVDRGHEILYPGGTQVPTSPGNVPDAPPWGGVSPSGASAVVTAALATWVFVQWVRKAIGG